MEERSGPLRILLVEDDSLVVLDLLEELRGLGYEIVGSAATGTEAIRLARELSPDLIILDIKMPELDGLEAAAQITALRPIPMIILSAYSDIPLIERAAHLGVLAYLVKPVDVRELEATIRVAMSRFREFQALRQEVADLREALETRKLVERAKGILMRRRNLTEEEAFRRLQRESQNQNRKIGDIAQAVIAADNLL
jgi:response regulator NasT